MRNKPKHFPSKLAEDLSLNKSEEYSLVDDLKTIVKTNKLIVFTLSYMNIYSIQLTLLTSLYSLTVTMLWPYKYTVDTIVNCTIYFLMGGMVG
jgi:hypothetical protein